MSRNERFKRKEEKSNIRIRYQSQRGQQGLKYARTPWAAHRWPPKMFTQRTSGGRTNTPSFTVSG